MAALKESTKKIFDYVKSMNGQNITAADISDATGIPPRSVTGSVTSFCKKGLMKRTPAEVEMPDGTHKAVKFISMTEEGMNFDISATEE